MMKNQLQLIEGELTVRACDAEYIARIFQDRPADARSMLGHLTERLRVLAEEVRRAASELP